MSEAQLTHSALQDLLCRNLYFTMDDSVANQQGRITPAQADSFTARSLRYNRTVPGYLIIFGIITLVTVMGLLIVTGGSNIMISRSS